MASSKAIPTGLNMIEEFDGHIEPTANKKCCKNCKHFCPIVYEYDDNESSYIDETDYGECRRFPPKPVPAEESGFPVVEHTTWCGEFDI